jgi:predicted RNA-binding Zn-ribbon protein involved in translation (DUF1610 family)
MLQGTIICEHCGSTNIVRDRELEYGVVQEKSKETAKPIGDPKTYFIFKCLSCGEGFIWRSSKRWSNYAR